MCCFTLLCLTQTLYHQQEHFWLYTLVRHDQYRCFDYITCRKNFTSDQKLHLCCWLFLAILSFAFFFFLKGKWQGKPLMCCLSVSYGPHIVSNYISIPGIALCCASATCSSFNIAQHSEQNLLGLLCLFGSSFSAAPVALDAKHQGKYLSMHGV